MRISDDTLQILQTLWAIIGEHYGILDATFREVDGVLVLV